MKKTESYKSKSAMMKHERKESPAKKSAEKKAGVKHASPTNKVAKVMGEFKRGTLHGGINPKGPKKAAVVTSRKQAIAIALSAARKAKKK